MRRRALLTAAGAGLFTLTGCLNAGDETTDWTGTADPTSGTATETKSTDGTPTETESTVDLPADALSVSFDRLQPAVVLARIDDFAVSESPDSQYVFVTVEVSAAEPPPRSAFGFRFDGTAHAPVDPHDLGGYDLQRAMEGEMPAYTSDTGAGWLLFELPDSGDASDAALTLGAQSWTVEGLPTERLEAPSPSFSVEWSVPETVAYDPTTEEVAAPIEIEMTVTNEGDHDGRFVAVLQRWGSWVEHVSVAQLRELIPAGETLQWVGSDSEWLDVKDVENVDDGEPDLEYRLKWSEQRQSQSVRIVTRDSETTAASLRDGYAAGARQA